MCEAHRVGVDTAMRAANTANERMKKQNEQWMTADIGSAMGKQLLTSNE